MVLTVLRPLIEKRRSAIDIIVMDATISERHIRNSEITEHPIQNGSYINDHVINQPATLTMDCFISDHPQKLNILQTLTRRLSLLSFSQRAFEYLNYLWREKKLLTVVSSLKIYRRMAIENITFDRNQETSNALRFQITLKQVRIFCRPEPIGVSDLQELTDALQKVRNRISRGRVLALDAGGQVEDITVDLLRDIR